MSTKIDIDYARHPAFQALPHAPSCTAITAYFEALDKLWLKLAGEQGTGIAVADVFRSEQARLLADIAPHVAGFTDEAYRPYLMQAFARSADAILGEIQCVVNAETARRRHGNAAKAIAGKLHDVSVVGFPMPPDLRARIAKSLAPFMEMLRQARASNDGARCFVAVPSWGEHWRLIKKFLRQNHVEEGISAYAGYPLELAGYALTYSHPDENWFKRCYADLGMEAPKTVQMHFDLENTSAKSMLYLNEIGSENGPFSYVPRSEAGIASRSKLSFMKYLDYAHADFATAQGAPASSYNRVLFATPALRRHFAALPAELQGSSCLGDDVLDGTPLSDALLKSERQITSKIGDLALFAGGETLHRGGIVTSGERWALQMLYKPPLSYPKKIMQTTTSILLRARNRYRELVN